MWTMCFRVKTPFSSPKIREREVTNIYNNLYISYRKHPLRTGVTKVGLKQIGRVANWDPWKQIKAIIYNK